MKRFFLSLFGYGLIATAILGPFLTLTSPFGSCGSTSRSAESNWRIPSYDVRIEVADQGTLHVTETIRADFFAAKHGIYRFIPNLFEPKGKGYRTDRFSVLDIRNVRVLLDGQAAPFELYTERASSCAESGWAGEFLTNTVLKIGDADRTIIGEQEYTITYDVDRSLRDDQGYPELYWNAIGDAWGVPIESATITVIGNKVAPITENARCYSGAYGSTDESRCTIEKSTEENSLYLTVPAGLQPFEGVTVRAALQVDNPDAIAGAVTGSKDRNLEYVMRKMYLLLVLIPCIYFYIMWRRFGRDPRTRGIIAPRYDTPDNLSPAQTGIVLDQRVDSVDIAALIVSIAQKGYMKIKEEKSGLFGIGQTYSFIQSTPTRKTTLSVEEEMVYSELFTASGRTSVRLADLAGKFHTVIEKVQSALQSWAVNEGYLRSIPGPFEGRLFIGYFMTGALWWIAFIDGSPLFFILLTVSTIVSIIILFYYRFYTRKGKEAQEEVLGLKMYMATAEKDRLEFHNAPEKSPELFERLLPFAMALGVTTIWADSFKDLQMKPPDWFEGQTSATRFNTVLFASHLTQASSSISRSMTSVPSRSSSAGGFSSGGGFSGGGGGGGGGGSW